MRILKFIPLAALLELSKVTIVFGSNNREHQLGPDVPQTKVIRYESIDSSVSSEFAIVEVKNEQYESEIVGDASIMTITIPSAVNSFEGWSSAFEQIWKIVLDINPGRFTSIKLINFSVPKLIRGRLEPFVQNLFQNRGIDASFDPLWSSFGLKKTEKSFVGFMSVQADSVRDDLDGSAILEGAAANPHILIVRFLIGDTSQDILSDSISKRTNYDKIAGDESGHIMIP